MEFNQDNQADMRGYPVLNANRDYDDKKENSKDRMIQSSFAQLIIDRLLHSDRAPFLQFDWRQ